MENILIHKLKVLIESQNGVVIGLNTDACTCIFPDDKFPFKMLDNENLDGYFYDESEEPMYKLEFKSKLKHEQNVANRCYELKRIV